MGKVSVGIIPLASLIVLAATLMAPAAASLMQTHFGFPVMVRSGQAFSFSNDVANSLESESMDIGFHLFDDIMSPSGTPAIGVSGWPTQGMAVPDLGRMGGLFDFSGFKFH